MTVIREEMITIILYLSQAILFDWFVGHFVKIKNKLTKPGKIVFVILYTSIREIIQYIWQVNLEANIIEQAAKQVLVFALLYILFATIYESYRQIRLFLTITFTAVSEISIMLVVEAMQLSPIIFDKLANDVTVGKISMDQFYKLINVYTLILQLSMDFVYAVILFLLLFLVVKNFHHKAAAIENEEVIYLITPSLIGLLIAYIFRGMFYSLDEGIPSIIYDKYPFLYILIPITLLMILLGVVLNIIFYQQILNKNEETMKSVMLAKQISAMEEHFRELERANESNRRLRHDLKNVITVLLDGEKIQRKGEEWEEYISDIRQSIASGERKISTASPVIDSLLNMKIHEALEKAPGITINAENLILNKELKIHSYDLSIIIGNAFDNAIEACQKIKSGQYINISGVKKNGMLLVCIRNSFDGVLNTNSKSRFPHSSKSDRLNHGMGMENMQRIADKYYGGVDYEIRNKEFILNIMLEDIEPNNN